MQESDVPTTNSPRTAQNDLYCMHMKRFLSSLAIALLFILPLSVRGETVAELQAELNALLAKIAALQTLLQAQQTTPTTPAVSALTGACPSLYRTLRQGMSGADVSSLQAFLASDALVYPEGAVTGYFGVLTQRAVERFQAKHGIASSGTPETNGFGLVGPATRVAIARACGGTPSAPTVSGTTQISQNSCSFGDITMAPGAVRAFYSRPTVPSGERCSSYLQVRQCVNGVLTGSAAFSHTTCSELPPSCVAANGATVLEGESIKLYSRSFVNVGESCDAYAQMRTCKGGVMQGDPSFSLSSCTVKTPQSCTFGGVTISHGQSRLFYSRDMAVGTTTCTSYSQSRTCTDGVLSGDNAYSIASCTSGGCTQDGVTLKSGESRTFYFASSVPAGEQCSSYAQTRTCSSGVLGGNAVYKYASCTSVSPSTCVLDNVVVKNGSSAVFYSTSTAPAGGSCATLKQTRSCKNGSLTGEAKYNRASCSDTAPCTLDGLTLTHGSSTLFYKKRSVAFGDTCSSVSLSRVCTNGDLSGSDDYKYAACSVNPPVSFGVNAQVAAALSVLESVLRSLLQEISF